MGITDTVLFVSDAHFGAPNGNEDERVEQFCEFAKFARENASALYIVGDFFDFWIEYDRAIRPDYFRVLCALRGMVDAGVDITYVAGNHDFAIGKFLEEHVGLRVVRGCANVAHQGVRLHVSHGDMIGKSRQQRAVLSLMRNRFLQSVYKMIHPNIGVHVGELVSAHSRKSGVARGGVSERKLEQYRRAARDLILSKRADIVVYAHTHVAELAVIEHGTYCNTGSWQNNYDYAILRDGKIQLAKWGESVA